MAGVITARIHPSQRTAHYYETVKSRSEFQRGLSILKKAGIISDSGTDIRKAEPFWVRTAGVRGGKHTLSELLNKYDDLVSGKVTPVTLAPKETKAYKKLGYEVTRGGKLLVQHSATQTVVADKKTGLFEFQDIHGINRLQIPCEFHNLRQYLACLRKNQDFIQDMRGKGRRFAFRFYGGHSRIYEDFDDLLEDLEKYETIVAAINSRSTRDMNEVYKNLELVTVSRSAWEKSKRLNWEKKRKESRNKPHARKRKLKRAKAAGGWTLDEYRRKRADEDRKYRASLTGAKLEAYKEKARARAKAAYKRNKL